MRLRYIAAGCLVTVSLAVLGLAWVGGSGAVGAASSRPLKTAIFDPINFPGPNAQVAFSHAYATGATAARLLLDWSAVAPTKPRPSSDPTDPTNPAYRWGSIDRLVKLAIQHGVEPILDVGSPPAWAEKPDASGAEPPNTQVARELQSPADLGKFMRAVARRYSGTFQGLPRIRYWEVWNEPNLSYFIVPQYVNEQTTSPAIYRQIVNAAADAIHGVHRDNVVIAGGTSPYQIGKPKTDPRLHAVAIAPLEFMRKLLCVSDDANPTPTCSDTITFDVWSHHPYTGGGPHGVAGSSGNVELGNLPEMKAVLDAAAKAGHIKSNGPVGFWVTEFSWDSMPTDPKGVPAKLEAEWVAETLWETWKWGVTLFTWFLVHDQTWTPKDATFQSSLYQPGATIAQDRPKPALAAFRFPFVGHIEQGKVSVWGRTPWGKPGQVLVEQSGTSGWKRLGVVTTDKYGIFERTFGAPTGTHVRARVLGKGGLSAPPFPLAGPKEFDVNPFGS